MIIGISGKMGSGKDTVGQMIIDSQHINWSIAKFADKLKKIAHLMTGYPIEDMYSQEGKHKFMPEWGMTIRDFQIKLGTEAVRDGIHQDGWILALFADYKEGEDNWIITDVRFPNEVKAIEQRGGVVVRINRSGIDRIDHVSETALDDYPFCEVIVNEGSLSDLRALVYCFIYKTHLNGKV
jgi:hypothetical protein